MLITLIKKEFLEHLLSLRFAVATVLTIVLVIVSIFVLRSDYAQKNEEYKENRNLYQKQLERERSYHSLEQGGVRIAKAPEKMLVTYYGLEKDDDRSAKIIGYTVPSLIGEKFKSPVTPLFPTPDVLYVVAIVLSLMAFVFSYDSISREREEGTLRLMLSHSVPRDLIILSKLVGGYISLVMPFLVAILVGSLVIMASGSIGFGTIEWTAFAVAGLISFLFLGVMFSLGVLVSTRCSKSSTSIMILLLVWVVMVLMVPNMSPFVANEISETTPYDAVETQVRKVMGDHLNDFIAAMGSFRMGREHRFRGGGEEADEARREFGEKMEELRGKLKKETNRAGERLWDQFQRELDAQVSLTKYISRLSPVSSYVYVATDLAGTGVVRKNSFLKALRTYQRDFRRYLEEKIKTSNGPSGHRAFFGMTRGRDFDISDMPQFSFPPQPVSQRVADSLFDILILVVDGVILFMLSFVSFLRVDVI